jgi:hypothetical protein
MTLEEIYYIGQTVSVFAIIGSLVFVGIQIRQNTRATQAASHHAVSNSLNEINRIFVENAEVTKIWLAGLNDRQGLSPEDRWRFDSLARAYMHVCETMYIQADLGTGDKEIMLSEENGIRTVLASPGVREWWAENPYGFGAKFRAYVAALEKKAAVKS